MNKPVIQAWIFVRGDSLELPGWNTRMLCGKPLIAYTIEAARRCRFIRDVFISTDSPAVAATAEQYGAIVPFLRPANLADILQPVIHSWRHAIEWNRQQNDFPQMDIMAALPITAPLRTTEDIEQAIDLYNTGNCDSVVAVSRSNRHPAYDMVFRDSNGFAQLIMPNSNPLERVRPKHAYDITNLIHVSSCNYIMQEENYLNGRVKTLEIPRERAIDIRDIWDFKLAEIIINETGQK